MHRRRWFPWALVAGLVCLAAPAGVLGWAATTASHAESPPSCYGIGWGCTLAPSDVGWLVAVAWLAVAFAVALGIAVSEVFGARLTAARSWTVLGVLVLAQVPLAGLAHAAVTSG